RGNGGFGLRPLLDDTHAVDDGLGKEPGHDGPDLRVVGRVHARHAVRIRKEPVARIRRERPTQRHLHVVAVPPRLEQLVPQHAVAAQNQDFHWHSSTMARSHPSSRDTRVSWSKWATTWAEGRD